MSEGREKSSRKRESILEEAGRLFWSKGFDKVTVKDIATACGCTQSNIYNHFNSKEEVLYMVLLGEMGRLIGMIQPLENDYNTSPVEQLRIFIERHVEHTLGPPKGELLHFEIEMRHLSPLHQVDIIQLRDAYDRILRKIIRRGVDAGLFAKVDEKLVNYVIASTIVRARVWYSIEGELSLTELSNGMFGLFLNGLRPRGKDSQEVEGQAFANSSGE